MSKWVKVTFIFISMAICFSVSGREVKFMDYFSIYADYKYPSINVGMYRKLRPSVGKEEKIRLRNVGLSEWKNKKYFGVLLSRTIELKIKKMDVKCYGISTGGKKDINCDIRVLFFKSEKNILFVTTEKIVHKAKPLGEYVTNISASKKINFSYFDIASQERKTKNEVLEISGGMSNGYVNRFFYNGLFFMKNKGIGFSMERKKYVYSPDPQKENVKLIYREKLQNKYSKLMIEATVDVISESGDFIFFEYNELSESETINRCLADGVSILFCFRTLDPYGSELGKPYGLKLRAVIHTISSSYFVFNYKRLDGSNDNEVRIVKKEGGSYFEIIKPNVHPSAATFSI